MKLSNPFIYVVVNSVFIVSQLILASPLSAKQKIENSFERSGAQLANAQIHNPRFEWGSYGRLDLTAQDSGYAISPDSKYALFKTQIKGQANQLFSIPIQGGDAVSLNAPLGADESAIYFRMTHDSKRVVFSVRNRASGASALYVVPINGGEPKELLSSDNGYKFSSLQEITLDNRYLLVIGAKAREVKDKDKHYGIYRLTLDGSEAPKRLTKPSGNRIIAVKISPDGNTIVFLADKTSVDKYGLFSVPIKGGEIVKLTNGSKHGEITRAKTGSSSRSRLGLDISPDSSRVIFSARNDSDRIYDLFSVPIRGGEAVKLNVPDANSGVPSRGVSDGNLWEISTDGRFVIYLDRTQSGRDKRPASIYSVPIGGGESVQLNRDPITKALFSVRDFRLIPGQENILFFTNNNILISNRSDPTPRNVSTKKQCSYPLAIVGGERAAFGNCRESIDIVSFGEKEPSTKIDFPSFDKILETKITLNEKYVVFVAYLKGSDATGLFLKNIAKGDVIQLNPESVGRPFTFSLSADSQFVIYRATVLDSRARTLFSHRIEY